MDTRVTSYSDYMRCLAAKYNNNPQSPPPAPASTQPPIPSTLKHELLPLLAAHQSAFPAFSLPGLSLFNPFLSQASETKPPASSGLTAGPREETHERLKRPKDDPLDLTDKKMKKEEPEEAEDRRSVSPSASLNKTPKNQSLLDWTVEEVEEFVSKVDDCGQYAKVRDLMNITRLEMQWSLTSLTVS